MKTARWSLVLGSVLSRCPWRGTPWAGGVFDFVLVGVVFAALQSGAVAGMLAGTIGGLLLDVLSGGVVGLGGLVKTLVGCAAGSWARSSWWPRRTPGP